MRISQPRPCNQPAAQLPQAPPPPQPQRPAKEPYSKPVLKRLGALKSVAGSGFRF
jgi:hypothetical protein